MERFTPPGDAAPLGPLGVILIRLSLEEGIAMSDLLSTRRAFFRHRAAAAWAARHAHGLSFPAIARELGGRDHTTAWHAFWRAEQLRADDAEFRVLTDRLLADARAAGTKARGNFQ